MNTQQTDKNSLDSAVIELHNIARAVEQNIGSGQLSEDLRKCADRLHELIKIQIGADHHAGDGGCEESTWEKYHEFAKNRNYPLP